MKLREKTTAILLTTLFLVSMLSATLVMANSNGLSIEWLPPLTSHDEFGFKDGSTLPIKFRLLDSSGSFVMDNPTVTVNDLLFSDDFEDGEADGWTSGPGDWAIENDDGNDVYSQNDITGNSAQRWALAGDYEWDDYIYEVKAKGIDGHYPGHGTHTWVGLVFRATDDTHFYEYYFRTTSQDIIVVKHDGGTRPVISGPVSFTCANGNWYKLKVIAEGNSFRFFVDDVEISGLAFTDDSFPNGKVGLYVWDGTHAHFDNVVVMGDERASFSIGDGLETPLKYKLFSEDFERVELGTGWEIVNGQWSIENGELNWISGDPGRLGIILDGVTATDGVFEYKIRPWEEVDYGKGMYIRYDDTTGYTYWIEIHYQRLHIYKFDTVGWRSVFSVPVSYALDGSTQYTIKTVAMGANLKVYFDGTEVIDYTDPDPLTGDMIGFRCWQHAHFDDVLVLGYQYQCNLHTKELGMQAGEYMITVSGDGYEYQHPFMLFEGGKAKGKPK